MSKPSKLTETHTKNGSSKKAPTSQGSSGENKNAQSFQVPETPNVTNSSDRDSCSKTVFQDPVLLAQFIRDYSDIPLLKNVRPEDIQNVTNRFVHLFSEDRNSDSINRIQLDGHTPFFIVSLIMMFNKLQNADDISKIQQIPPEQINEIISETPEYLLDIMAQVIRAFLLHINLPIKETDDIVGNIKERKMGYFFEHAEKMDIQEERRLRKEAEERLANALAEKDNAIAERESTIALSGCKVLYCISLISL